MKGLLYVLVAAAFLRSVAADDGGVPRKNPRLAVTLSVVPGGGQAYNGKYAKAALTFGVGAGLAAWRLTATEPDLRERLSWWLVGVYIYNLLDAYVDAHLAGFDEQTGRSIVPKKKIEESDSEELLLQ